MNSKTTLYLPEDLHRRLKETAGRRGTTLSALLAEGARLVLDRDEGATDREELIRRGREAEEALRMGLYEGPSVSRTADDLVYRASKVAERSPRKR